MLIESSNFDLIIIGTGLPESIIATAASSVGKKVIQFDPNPFYGTHYSSFTSLSDLTSFLHSQSQSSTTLDETTTIVVVDSYIAHSTPTSKQNHPMNSLLRTIPQSLIGPRVILCADSMAKLICSAGIGDYVEFDSVDAIFISDSKGSFVNVPYSKNAICRDANLNLFETNRLAEFLKNEQMISEYDLERPFFELLDRYKLSHRLK